MSKDNKYTLVVNKKRVSVTEEVYKAYYQQKEHEVYLDKLSSQHNISFDECEEKGLQVEYILSQTTESIEDCIIKQELIVKMMLCLKMLSKEDQLLIYNLFFEEKSELQVAKELNINQSNVNRRKTKILNKIKKLIEL